MGTCAECSLLCAHAAQKRFEGFVTSSSSNHPEVGFLQPDPTPIACVVQKAKIQTITCTLQRERIDPDDAS